MAKKYKHRHREIYKGVSIDIKADTIPDLIGKLERKRTSIDQQVIDPNMKLADFVQLWLETYREETVGADWYSNLCYIVFNKIVPSIGNKPVEKIHVIDIQNFLNQCSEYSNEYLNKIFQTTKQIFKSAYLNGMIKTDYTLHLTKPKGKKVNSRRSITDCERDVLLRVLSGEITEAYATTKKYQINPKPHRGNLFCKFSLYCGLRPSEAAALQWKDINFTNGVLSVTKAWDKNGIEKYPKSDAGIRKIPIPKIFLDELRTFKRDPFESPTLIDGKPPTIARRRAMWTNVKRLMNIGMGCRVYRNELIPPFPLADDFVMYNLRHTYCTDLEKAGVPINVASRLMGHSDISITAKIYTHESAETIETARNLLDLMERKRETSF